MPAERISVEDARRLLKQPPGAMLIDVRSRGEFESLHAADATSVPLDALDVPAIAAARGPDAPPLLVICQSGARATQACERLTSAGVTGVRCVDGGTAAWQRAGLPVVRGRGPISMERQVRIAAGSLVVLGLAGAWLVHPACAALALLVGVGLVFSGITNTCGMARVLVMLPWNR